MSVISRMSYVALVMASFVVAACKDVTEPPAAPPAVARVTVSPPEGALVIGDAISFTARALDGAGKVISGRAVAWSTSDPLVATVSSAGLVTGIAVGRATIRATIDGKVGSAEAQVSLAPVSSVEVDPPAVQLTKGEFVTARATARDAAGRVLHGRTITWTSLDASIVEVDASGKLTARGVGTTTVTASAEGRSATITVTVNRLPVASITVRPTALVLEVGETQQLTATVKDAAGNELDDREITWTGDANASVSNTGLVTALHPGYASIVAESEGKTFTVAATIEAPEPSPYELLYHRQSSASVSEIFILALGTNVAPVKLNAGNVSSQATASPDGARIAFFVSQIDQGTQKEIRDIFAVNRNGMFMKQLTTHADIEDEPAWSPAGTKIAYRRYAPAGRMDIWVMNPDASGQTNLTADLAAGVNASAPAWSHDGSRIAFSTMENSATGTTASIWVMDASGANKRRLTSTTSGFDATPTWSPDGQHVAFIRYFAGDADIVVQDVNAGTESRLALPGMQWTPAWSPDGLFIAFAQSDAAFQNIYTVRPDGMGLRLRTTDPAWRGGYRPSWIAAP